MQKCQVWLARMLRRITTPAFVRYSRKNMEEGARKAGKTRRAGPRFSHRRSIGRDSSKGRKARREQAAMNLANKSEHKAQRRLLNAPT